MAQTLVFDCGHCDARDQTFDILSKEVQNVSTYGSPRQELYLGVRCRRCRMVSCVVSPWAYSSDLSHKLDHSQDLTSALFSRAYIVPSPRKPDIPLHTPDIVGRAFVQAEKQVKDPSMTESAAVMYGRTVETALKKVAESKGIEFKGTTLVRRIDEAADLNLIPRDLAEWAHKVRELRNEGAHGESVTQKSLMELRGFVDLLLRYLFTLPGTLKELKGASEDGDNPATNGA